MKTLTSGITVDEEQFYRLLDWKDNNLKKFQWWCREYGLYQDKEQSINAFDRVLYNALLDFAGIN